jgi:hypothetical protein
MDANNMPKTPGAYDEALKQMGAPGMLRLEPTAPVLPRASAHWP